MTEMKLKVNNFAKQVGVRNGRNYFVWRVFIDEDQELLNKIKSVEYLLHPTFPNPLRVIEDRNSKFALDSSGWGNFNLQITAKFIDGNVFHSTYFVDLSKPWPKEAAELPSLKENLVFVNGVPGLYKALEKSGRKEEAQMMVKNFLVSSFNEDLDKKVERFLKLPSGIFPADSLYFKFFWELNQLYIDGLYYSTVVMAGVLCEKMCYDILMRSDVKLGSGPLPLTELIQLLTKEKLARKESVDAMQVIRLKKNEYMHSANKDLDSISDATLMVEKVTEIMKNEFSLTPIDSSNRGNV